MKRILIEGHPEHHIYEVRGESIANSQCSCGRERCFHLRVGTDILFNEGKRGARWICKSGLHKAIRLSDMTSALRWAHWFKELWGEGNVVRYLRRIWSEETVNLDLLVCADETTAIEELVYLLCASRKRWEFDEAWQGFLMKSEAESQSARGSARELLTSPQERRAALTRNDNLSILSALMTPDEVGKLNGAKKVLRLLFLADTNARGLLTTRQFEAFARRYASGCFEDEDTIVAMLRAGLIKSEMNEFRRIERVELGEPYFPFPQPCVMDYHTLWGQQRLQAWRRETGGHIWFGVELGKLDYRLSGGPIPLAWRFLAWKRFGAKLFEKRWTDVVLTNAEESAMVGMTWASEHRLARMEATEEST